MSVECGMAAASVEFHTLESTVRGRHVYKTLWNPVVGHVLHIQSEDSNTYDRFAVATHLRASSFQSVASPEHFGQRYWLLLSLFLLSLSLKDVASWQSA
jgi:hypothetical protein